MRTREVSGSGGAVASNLLENVFSPFPAEGRDSYMRAFSKAMSEHDAAGGGSGLRLHADGRLVETAVVDHGARGHVVPDARIGGVFAARFGATPTATEIRVLRGLVAGQSLKEIGAADGVSYETRRNQLKSLLEKAGLARQVQLVSTMSTLIVLAATQDARASRKSAKLLRDLLDRHSPGQGRIYAPQLADGKELLILDLGPPDGRPVLHMHSAFFPIFPFPPDLPLLTRLNLRVITPFRPGFFGLAVDRAASPAARTEAFTATLAAFLEDFDLADAPVFSHAHGITAAVSLCRRLGNRVPRLVAHGAQYTPPGGHSRQPAHIGAQFRLIDKSPRLLHELYRLLALAVARPQRLAETLDRVFEGSAADRAAVRDPARKSWLYETIARSGASNIPGIVSDLGAMSSDWLDPLMDLPMPVHLIYGQDDAYANHGAVAGRAHGSAVRVTRLPGEGLISMMFDPAAILADLAAGLPADAAAPVSGARRDAG